MVIAVKRNECLYLNPCLRQPGLAPEHRNPQEGRKQNKRGTLSLVGA